MSKPDQNARPGTGQQPGPDEVKVKRQGVGKKRYWLIVKRNELVTGFTFVGKQATTTSIREGSYRVCERDSPTGNKQRVFVIVGSKPRMFVNKNYLEQSAKGAGQVVESNEKPSLKAA